MPFINLFFGVAVVGILSFETGLRADFSRNLQSDCIQLIMDQVSHSDNGDTKFVKNKVPAYLPVHPYDYLPDHDSYMTKYLSISEFIFILQKKSDYHIYSYLLPSVTDLPPPFLLTILS